MSEPNYNELLEHFGISESNGEQMTVFDCEKIERIGSAIAFYLAKGKGRAIIDYDPAYPHAALRICTDTPNIPETYKVTWDGERYVFEPVPPNDLKGQSP
ncbi:MAG: hypothetical protein OSJ43_05365 [Oscillospiraceae bacterium]|nr:hypothetical protein [Oscillospiraceae bacterium]